MSWCEECHGAGVITVRGTYLYCPSCSHPSLHNKPFEFTKAIELQRQVAKEQEAKIQKSFEAELESE